MRPNYKKIYTDLLLEKQPEKLKDEKIKSLISDLTTAEKVLKFNELIFGLQGEDTVNNHKLRSYDKQTIIKILQYQKKHNLSKRFTAMKYGISRTTIQKWHKDFGHEIE
ncbi:helix-turn-helix domain-containing protein [Chryseobacterium fluminis]|uniref:helix-turn-helix domain-containing protein n=1 Tax=Chryseobacterium fluminis TaxID=2983606 RepID=UPI00225935E3|nr:helix-turn-helix domain-containing protein [Chryseobacterium sp. MMS21-Ot14]UZT97983.1 helix-turn-helix domain-containing protein [Chryseobacterium sp. MMS21-Ot14]